MSTAGPRAIRNHFGARPRPRGYGPDETGRLIECDSFAQLNWSGFMIEAGDVDLHRSSSGLNPLWETNVRAENSRT